MGKNAKLSMMTDLIQELNPEELESRLELQVLVDPMSMSNQNANNNRANNNRANNN